MTAILPQHKKFCILLYESSTDGGYGVTLDFPLLESFNKKLKLSFGQAAQLIQILRDLGAIRFVPTDNSAIELAFLPGFFKLLNRQQFHKSKSGKSTKLNPASKSNGGPING